jgi:hypothetical protein
MATNKFARVRQALRATQAKEDALDVLLGRNQPLH